MVPIFNLEMIIGLLNTGKMQSLCRKLTAFPIFRIVADSASRKPMVSKFVIKKEK